MTMSVQPASTVTMLVSAQHDSVWQRNGDIHQHTHRPGIIGPVRNMNGQISGGQCDRIVRIAGQYG